MLEENKTDKVESSMPKVAGDTITISKKLYKRFVVTGIVGALIIIVAVVFSVYTWISNNGNRARVQELQKVNQLQQEQLQELNKRASKLESNLNDLLKLQDQLQQLSGKPQVPVNPTGNNKGGEGGPEVGPITIGEVSKTYDNIENMVNAYQGRLQALKQQLNQDLITKQLSNLGGDSTAIPSIWPAQGIISSPFGLRWGGTDFHPGIDIANEVGTPIHATADGIVTTAGWNAGGYGNMVDIDHGHGIMTRYGHASYVVVRAGQHVKRGQIIAYMGSTGFSTGPHVHYEVRINGKPVNPASYMLRK